MLPAVATRGDPEDEPTKKLVAEQLQARLIRSGAARMEFPLTRRGWRSARASGIALPFNRSMTATRPLGAVAWMIATGETPRMLHPSPSPLERCTCLLAGGFCDEPRFLADRPC